MNFKIKDGEQVRSKTCTIASAIVIEAGDLVAMTAGLIVKAVAASTKVAYALNSSANGDTKVEVTVGDDFTLEGTADANFAVTQKGTEVNITNAQLIDVGTSSTGVLKVGIGENTGVVGETSDVEVKINHPLF